jgi:heme O synthase-like polyprenyltransferase
MNRRTLAGDRQRRRLMTFLWSALLSIAVIILIYKELTAILYILCTVGVAVLLIIVAFSDLAHDDGKGAAAAQTTDAAGVAGRER